MWKLKQFMPKEPTGLEGRSIDVGNLKLHIRNVIAEGGFSCVYLARDIMNPMKQYALKHIICNDGESLELAMKEISVMKLLKGHPNIVTLCAQAIVDMGRTKEVLLVMDFCERSLVNVIEIRGAGYFDEKQVLKIFRDVCNAVFAMHCLSPPIAHRDLKAENLLLGSDGLWKLCDFGSTSTNHKRFEKPEEMGIEEDIIRKHTTPAYRAPEMWDLFRREVINEKVDIWALGCVLFRICYFKSAFDGESKLQVLNGNYKIPELPRFSSSMTDLIRDMLQSSPDARPDIMQVWLRVNEMLPTNMQKSLPDRPPEMRSNIPEGSFIPANKSSLAPRRSPPPPPSSHEPTQNSAAAAAITSKVGGDGGPLGAFWATQHAKDFVPSESSRGSKFDEEHTTFSTPKRDWNRTENYPSDAPKDENILPCPVQKSIQGKPSTTFEGGSAKCSEMNFFQEVPSRATEKPKVSRSENVGVFQNEAFNTFVAEFDTRQLDSTHDGNKSGNEEIELERLKEQLRQTSIEKAEISSKYEKLTAICRSQRLEIQELKQVLAARTPSPNRDASRNQTSAGTGGNPSNTKGKVEGTAWEFQPGISVSKPQNPESKSWQPFSEDPKPQVQPTNSSIKSVRSKNNSQFKHFTELTPASDSWGFGSDSFTAVPAAGSQMLGTSSAGSNSRRFSDFNKESNPQTQPAGWAGF